MSQEVVLMILIQKFLPDIRVEQEYKALKDAGFRIIVLANKHGWNNDNYEVIRINPNRRWSNLFNMTLTFNPVLKALIIHELKKNGISHVDVIHVHDLFWSFLGINLSRYFGSKLVIDLHENYPEFIRDTRECRKIGEISMTKKQKTKGVLKNTIHPFTSLSAFLQKRAYSINRLILYEDLVLNKCDRFIVVVEEYLEKFKHKSYYRKGVIVSNTKDHRLWHFENLPEIDDKLIVTYVGSIQNLRGLDTAILAMNYLNQAEYELNIVGINKESLICKNFIRTIKNNNISNVNLVEWLENSSDAFSYISKSHICIVPHRNTGLTQTTVPHKLFMYMAMGRPVLVSDVAPLKRIVNESKCGLVFKADDPYDFAEKLKKMKNPDLLNRLAINGRRAVENKYDWDNDKNILLNMYSELLNKNQN